MPLKMSVEGSSQGRGKRRNTMNAFNTVLMSFAIFAQLAVVKTMAGEITGSETREPEIFLRPRNFNPHPYENQIYRQAASATSGNLYNLGPVQFPPLAGYEDRHPYAALTLKNRPPIPLQRNDRPASPEAFHALARHAKKVLNGYQGEDDYSSLPKKHYAFSYRVHDIASGDDFSHTQQQKNGAVSGSYKVQLPDGRIQVVKYTADDNGYRADVSYTEDSKPIPQVHATAPPQYAYYKDVDTVPVAVSSPQPQTYDYNLYIGDPHPNLGHQEQEVYSHPSPVTAEPPKSYYSQTTTTSMPPSVQYKEYSLLSGLTAPYGTVKTVFVDPANNPISNGYIEYADNYLGASSNRKYSHAVSTPSPLPEKAVSTSNLAIYYEKK